MRAEITFGGSGGVALRGGVCVKGGRVVKGRVPEGRDGFPNQELFALWSARPSQLR